jgi:hypothetical protein
VAAAPQTAIAPVPASPRGTALPDSSEVASVHPVTTVVVTDDPAVAATGSAAEKNWPSLLARRLASAGSPLEVTLAVAEGAGFADSDRSFTDLVHGTVTHPTQLVIFLDTRGDFTAPSAAGSGVADALGAVEERAPDGIAVVVGPWASQDDMRAPSADVRRAVRDSALHTEVTVTYVDPVAEDWPVGATQQQLADLLYPHVAPLAEMLARSGAFD